MQSSLGDREDLARYRLDEGIHLWTKLAATPSSVEQRSLFALLSEFLANLQRNLRFDHFALGFYHPAKDVLSVVFEAGAFRLPREVPVHGSALSVVVHQQQGIEVSDTSSETRFADVVALAANAGFRSFRVVPLSTHTRRLGTMGVARRQPGPFSDDDVRRLEHAAQLVALVMENAFMADVLAGEKARLETSCMSVRRSCRVSRYSGSSTMFPYSCSVSFATISLIWRFTIQTTAR